MNLIKQCISVLAVALVSILITCGQTWAQGSADKRQEKAEKKSDMKPEKKSDMKPEKKSDTKAKKEMKGDRMPAATGSGSGGGGSGQGGGGTSGGGTSGGGN